MTRVLLAVLIASGAARCASAPPAPPPPPIAPIAPPGPTFEQKMAWMLRLEDQRMLRDSAPELPSPPLPPPTPTPTRGLQAPPVAPPPPSPPTPDLVRLLEDPEARIRRRAALAVGRVGLAAGVDPLVALLADADTEVRQMAAFALGLLGDRRAREPLVRALADPSPLMKGSAAEALGLIGDPVAAASIGAMVGELLQSGAVTERSGDDADLRGDTPAAAFRLGVYALVRLRAYEPLAAAVLDPSGQPRTTWWPVAFALQRLEDKRALTALLALAKDAHPYTRAFAVKGLGALKDRTAIPAIAPLVSGGVKAVSIEAVRALGRIGDPGGGPALVKIAQDRSADVQLRVEAVAALGATRVPGVGDLLLDLLSDASPELRAAALRSTATLDSEDFVAILSGLDPDPNYTVRAALASVLATLPPEIGLPRLGTMINDSDQRVVPSVLAALVKLKDPKAPAILLDRLKADDPAVRAAAAAGLGELKPAGAAQALAAAYADGQRDGSYIARAAALAALSKYGPAEATPVIRTALTDKDWAVRVKAATLLKEMDPTSDAANRIRPAPTRLAPDVYQAPRLVNPAVSTQAYLDTDRGTIQIDLAVLEAPLTVENFVTLARAGFFNGLSVHRVVPDFVIQSGDPRGDGEGGPDFTIRDELNELPYVRGSVGMALDWPDTGGSQFFITHSPQPHLDAKYTIFGRVTMGMEVVDAIQQGDVIRRVRIWDGVTMSP